MPVVNTAELKAGICIPAAGPWFEGHFPGKPILPGVAELAFAIAALRHETGKPLPLRGIVFARLRHLVLPGDRLELSARQSAGADGEPERLRFELQRDGVLVANGEFMVGAPLSQSDASPDRRTRTSLRGNSPAGNFPSLDTLLPHRPPMRFVESILQQSAEGLDCVARVPARCALVVDGAPVLAAIEAAAQAAAVWEALQRWHQHGEGAPRVGYLVAMRDITFFTDSIPADQPLFVSVRLQAVSPPLSHYRFDVSLEGSHLVQGTVGTYLAA